MEKKRMGWKTKGMNRDWAVSSFNQEFAFENHNLRLITNEKNTLMSWVNEKGSKEIIPNINYTPWIEDENEAIRGTTIYGVPIGTAVINHQLVIFTHNVSTNTQAPPIIRPDSIYVFWQDNDTLYGKVLYNGNEQ
jgi:hypothetical protein